ncbi:hypothetical protein AB0M29_07395, partial [Streptomyces sp. NPDC051976]|uniref:wHTH domain-containing protein n=1 Tax=Streptomyces sp. NPDC051976 TaxID=3154947 RepID=UPI00343C1483
TPPCPSTEIASATRQRTPQRRLITPTETARLMPDTENVDELTDDDRRLLSEERTPVVTGRPVPWPQLYLIARRTGQGVAEVTARLRNLGHDVPKTYPAPSDPLDRSIALLAECKLDVYTLHLMDEPVFLPQLIYMADTKKHSLSALAEALTTLGYTVSVDVEELDQLSERDTSSLSYSLPLLMRFYPVTPVELYAIARHVDRPRADVAADLAALGCTIDPTDEEFERDVRAEERLERAITAPQEAVATEGEPSAISLSALAAVALRQGKTLREVGLRANTCGMRHEAEGWFA